MRSFLRRTFWKTALPALACILALSGCFGESVQDVEIDAGVAEVASGNQEYAANSWAVYWYHCGSDLESKWGCASEDLQEMLAVELPETVQVVVQTGGAKTWHNSQVDAEKLQRYVYSSDGFNLVDEQPRGNMGSPDTLADFLSFCWEHYPAAHRMVVIWNHGGGSVGGAAYDQNYRYDSLTLDEFYDAFSRALPLSQENPPLDIVGFDTCLMATVDTAYALCDVARYLVASEESEPGCGWYYTDWFQALAEDPGMDGAALGKVICDSFQKRCEKEEVAEEITLSVTDLSKIGTLMDAYESLGREALMNAVENPGFFPDFGRMASRAENYGGNTEDSGYTNMVDLGDLARQCEDLLPESSQAVQTALQDCVVYKINGPYRAKATGLSCYYSYNGDKEDYDSYTSISACDAFTYLYGYELEGTLDKDGMAYLNGLGYEEEEVPDVPTLDTVDEDFPIYVNEDGSAVLDVGPEVANILKGVYFRLAYLDEDVDAALLLGQDNNMTMDWENGVFTENFQGAWGAIDGSPVYMEIVYEGDDYTTYSVPILLNGERYSLRVVYDYNDQCYYILGARRGVDAQGMADKNLIQLQPGDQVTPILYGASVSGDDAFEEFETDPITVTENTSFADVDLGDGEFLMLFELVDARNTTFWSESVVFTVQDGTIYTEAVE